MNTVIERDHNRHGTNADSAADAAAVAAAASSPVHGTGRGVAASWLSSTAAAAAMTPGLPLPGVLERPLIAAAAAAPLHDPARSPVPPPTHAPRRKRRRQQQRQDGKPGIAAAARRSLWRGPMTVAVIAGTLLVGLLCVYVYAYARVAMASFEAATLRKELRRAEQQEKELLAEISQQRMPHTVAKRAKDMGMELAPDEAIHQLTGSDLAPAAGTAAAAAAALAAPPAMTRPSPQNLPSAVSGVPSGAAPAASPVSDNHKQPSGE
jgi:cell division protein FtsL